jgi:hypothetical protein
MSARFTSAGFPVRPPSAASLRAPRHERAPARLRSRDGPPQTSAAGTSRAEGRSPRTVRFRSPGAFRRVAGRALAATPRDARCAAAGSPIRRGMWLQGSRCRGADIMASRITAWGTIQGERYPPSARLCCHVLLDTGRPLRSTGVRKGRQALSPTVDGGAHWWSMPFKRVDNQVDLQAVAASTGPRARLQERRNNEGPGVARGGEGCGGLRQQHSRANAASGSLSTTSTPSGRLPIHAGTSV